MKSLQTQLSSSRRGVAAKKYFANGSACLLLGIGLLLLAAFGYLAGCGSSSTITSLHTTRFLVVSEQLNNRVLIYNTPLSNGQSANVVLGQADFTSSAAATTATGMSSPAAAAEDSAGNIYISDASNNRVLQFKPPFANGMSASLVIGQPDFTTSTPKTTQNGLGGPPPGFIDPVGLVFDNSGNLWVADPNNSRILQYKPPFATNMNASLVIGQADFTSGAPATTNSGLGGPFDIAFDGGGNLWVSDLANNRVLEFKPPFGNGMAASLVIGQADFTSGSPDQGGAVTASGLDGPWGLAFDSTGDLWVVDGNNNRVLEFRPPFANGMSASLVIGQPDFVTNTPNTTQNGLGSVVFGGPSGLAFDSSGNLGVADSGNHRTLGFKPPFSNNQNASLVLGQADFTSGAGATTATGEFEPLGVLAAF